MRQGPCRFSGGLRRHILRRRLQPSGEACPVPLVHHGCNTVRRRVGAVAQQGPRRPPDRRVPLGSNSRQWEAAPGIWAQASQRCPGHPCSGKHHALSRMLQKKVSTHAKRRHALPSPPLNNRGKLKFLVYISHFWIASETRANAVQGTTH